MIHLISIQIRTYTEKMHPDPYPNSGKRGRFNLSRGLELRRGLNMVGFT